jgi:hypothetical protein
MTMACIRKRRGKWVADYRDPSGRRRWITRDTRKEAEAALAAIHVAIAKDEYVAPDTTRTLQTVYDHWWRVAVMGSDNKRGKPLSQGSKGPRKNNVAVTGDMYHLDECFQRCWTMP